jgi:hypothetical protein
MVPAGSGACLWYGLDEVSKIRDLLNEHNADDLFTEVQITLYYMETEGEIGHRRWESVTAFLLTNRNYSIMLKPLKS